MKRTAHLLACVAGVPLALWPALAGAESTYGYIGSGAAGATASARVNITVKVPMLILLRVGDDGSTITEALLNATLSGGTIPGGVAPGGDVSNAATGWTGAAPGWTAPAATVRAWAWTNSRNGGQLDQQLVSAFAAASGLTAGNIAVASAAAGATPLDHPGTDTLTNVGTAFAKNLVAVSDWTYSISGLGLAGAAAGTWTQQVRYTASSL